VLSGGRVNCGAGRGFEPAELQNFGVSMEESAGRFREGVEIVLAAWRSERLHFEGTYFRFDGVEALPKPLQRPHPSVCVAPPRTRRSSGPQQGHSVLTDPHAAHVEIARKHRLYRARLAEHGHSPAGRETPMARLLAVAPAEEQALEVARRGLDRRILHGADARRTQLTEPPRNPGRFSSPWQLKSVMS
jgi:alkanesulfonate monooxygenase SsuD/methylene tetrahydromethanopterin reductase-like flavin-dependent oxidoreductase (luciferase family)